MAAKIIAANPRLAAEAAKHAEALYGSEVPALEEIQLENLTTTTEVAAAHVMASLLLDLVTATDGKTDGKYVCLPTDTMIEFLKGHQAPGYAGSSKHKVLGAGLQALKNAGFIGLWPGARVPFAILKPCMGWHQDGAVELLGTRLAELTLGLSQ